jgi:hypothetical protein
MQARTFLSSLKRLQHFLNHLLPRLLLKLLKKLYTFQQKKGQQKKLITQKKIIILRVEISKEIKNKKGKTMIKNHRSLCQNSLLLN